RKPERDLLHNVLTLWVGARMESQRERICGPEVLGMSPQDWDPDADNYGHFLIPPVLQAQIELLTTVYVLLPMKKAVLKELESLVKNNRTQSWFTIYLCMFIIMHSCALLTKAERVRAQREPRMPNSPSEAQYYDPKLVGEFHRGAEILLGYFHYNNKGALPFELDWSAPDSGIAFAELGHEEILFMQASTEEIKRK
ncbi:hypothetical protein DH86_00003664, partial [Scytalidium sp. 3C]